jgi:hypothetical protein
MAFNSRSSSWLSEKEEREMIPLDHHEDHAEQVHFILNNKYYIHSLIRLMQFDDCNLCPDHHKDPSRSRIERESTLKPDLSLKYDWMKRSDRDSDLCNLAYYSYLNIRNMHWKTHQNDGEGDFHRRDYLLSFIIKVHSLLMCFLVEVDGLLLCIQIQVSFRELWGWKEGKAVLITFWLPSSTSVPTTKEVFLNLDQERKNEEWTQNTIIKFLCDQELVIMMRVCVWAASSSSF